MKKWIFVAALVVIFVLMLVLPPPVAQARGGFGQGCLLGACVGIAFGWLFERHVMEPESPYPPHISPPQGSCYREVPGHWMQRWNPHTGYYEEVWIRRHLAPVPCQ